MVNRSDVSHEAARRIHHDGGREDDSRATRARRQADYVAP
jgi:hypothetical protein